MLVFNQSRIALTSAILAAACSYSLLAQAEIVLKQPLPAEVQQSEEAVTESEESAVDFSDTFAQLEKAYKDYKA